MASFVPFPVTNWRVLQLFAFTALFLCYQTLAEAPSKVRGITVTKILSYRPALSVTWSAVSGSNITYNVCYSMEEGEPRVPPLGQSVCKAGITGPYITLYPLSGGTTYYIWVRAESSGRQGPYSRRRMETTYNVIGWGNKSVEIVSYSHMLSLKWDDFGDFIYALYYQKTGTRDVSTVTTTSLSYNITGLDSNTRYVVIVAATNDVTSAINEEMYPYTTPESPGPVTLTTLSSTSINVRWSPPPNSDRSPLTYHVNYTGISRSTSDTTLTLTGLHPYEEYSISVQAGNEGGLSVPVAGTARTYSDTKPSKIRGVTVTKVPSTRPALKVSWRAVGGSNIFYTVCYSVEEGKPEAPPPGQSDCIAGITEPYTTLHPLSGGTTYYIWVRAVSSGGRGPYSDRKMEATYNVIAWEGEPVEIISYSSMLQLKWNYFGYINFTLLYWKTSTPSVVFTVTTTSLSYNITGLDSNTAYKVIVYAKKDDTLAIGSRVILHTTPEC